MKKILLVVFSNAHSDPRVLRQIASLKQHYCITVASFTNPDIDDVNFIKLQFNKENNFLKVFLRRILGSIKLILQMHEQFYWNQYPVKKFNYKSKNLDADLIIANDIDTLPLCLLIAKTIPVVVDLHEYSPLEFEDRFIFRLLLKRYKTYLCEKYIRKAKCAVTVAPTISEKYKKLTGTSSLIVSNASKYVEMKPKIISKYPIKIIHHGAALKSRKIEDMIHVMDLVDNRFELHFMLVGNGEYIKKLKSIANNKNIYFHDPVEYSEIVNTISNYDIGMFYLYPSNFNYKYALPNKFFEFIQARLATIIGPSPEMKRLVNLYKIGEVSEEFTIESLAQTIRSLSIDRINQYKINANAAAKILCSDSFEANYFSVVSNII